MSLLPSVSLKHSITTQLLSKERFKEKSIESVDVHIYCIYNLAMSNENFEWDEAKRQANLKKRREKPAYIGKKSKPRGT